MINADGRNGRRGERGTCHALQCNGLANERTQRALQAKGAATRRNYCLRAAWHTTLPLNACRRGLELRSCDDVRAHGALQTRQPASGANAA
jgi:hypothetical protein